MKKEEVPQDKSSLKSISKELYYATDKNGDYTTELSSGWTPKKIALENAIDEINQRINQTKKRMQKGETSPIEYYMELHKMDLGILAAYVGMWKWSVKRHFKPQVFKKMKPNLLKKYAEIFEVSIKELKHPQIDKEANKGV